jgi:UDP-glucose 4-epimerase
MKILVTGSAGYIGAHTIADLLQHGFEVIGVDNFCRSTDRLLKGIEQIHGKPFTNYNIDLCNLHATKQIFKEQQIDGIIHFAALKSVAESVTIPLAYYQNNLQSLQNILQCVQEFNVPHFVFSSSCSVYGNSTELPVTEATPLQEAQSPYGATKQIGEKIIQDVQKVMDGHFYLLRYFNPTGAHPSNAIGEITIGKPSYLVPSIVQNATGQMPQMTVFGTDYPTRDGSCVRDFIHVCDIAHAHTLALQHSINQTEKSYCKIYNLGSGNGVTVLEALHSFEKVNNIKLNYVLGDRREGDVIAVYADNTKATTELNWHCAYSLDQMMRTAWLWEQQLQTEK